MKFMRLKKKLLDQAEFYLILDRQVNTHTELFEIAKTAIRAGVGLIQLRDKQGRAKDILELSVRIARLSKSRTLFIVNDRVDIALASGADGAHLGQDDLPLPIARKILGKDKILGASCQTLTQAQTAEREGADYIGFGSVFKTLTKPDRQPMNLDVLSKVIQTIKIPIFAIGGINPNNISKLRDLGVSRFAVCRAVCQAADAEKAIEKFKL